MHYYVVGVNGSGKTTFLRAVQARSGIAVVPGTVELMKYLDLGNDYVALRALDQQYVLQKWGEVAEGLVKTYGDTSFLLDTHILNLTGGKIIRRDGPWIADYDALVLVTADPKELRRRIELDANRDRALFPSRMTEPDKLKLLDAYQQQTAELFAALSKKYNLPNKIIQNGDTLDDAVAEFLKFDNGLRTKQGV